MGQHVPWVDRTFSFDFPAGHYREILERLRGTPARAEDRVRNIQTAILTVCPGGKWSIQQHLGHLADLESLLVERLDDFESAAAALRAADMHNRATEEARHNDRVLTDVLRDLRRERSVLMQRLDALPSAFFSRSAMHPRLERPLRVVDMLLFHAEHDDYHMARITELVRALS